MLHKKFVKDKVRIRYEKKKINRVTWRRNYGCESDCAGQYIGGTGIGSGDRTDLSVDTQAEQGVIKDSGACGATENDDVTWTVYDTDSDGKGDKLVISGEGDMMSPAYSGDYPWKANAYEKI